MRFVHLTTGTCRNTTLAKLSEDLTSEERQKLYGVLVDFPSFAWSIA